MKRYRSRHLTLKELIKSQLGQTNIIIDRMLFAKKKGWRESASGNRYYESRANRSDVRRRWRL